MENEDDLKKEDNHENKGDLKNEDNLKNEDDLKNEVDQNKDNLKNEDAVRSNTSQLLYHWATSTCLKEGGRTLTDNQIPRSCS